MLCEIRSWVRYAFGIKTMAIGADDEGVDEAWPAPKKLDDTRLAPRASRTELLALPEGAERAEVSASSHRMTRETAEYHHLGDYPLSVETHRLEVSGE